MVSAAAELPGIGEMFGQTVDTVRRRPIVAIVPLLMDVGAFLIALLVVAAIDPSTIDNAYGHAVFGFGISTGLPSLVDTFDVIAASQGVADRWLLFLGAFAVVLVPVAAYVEAGFVGLVHKSYVEGKEEPIVDLFLPTARARFLPMFFYRATLVGGFILLLILSTRTDSRNGVAGALALRFLLLFVPYAIVVDEASFLDAVKQSLLAIVDHLATCLVLLLFLLLVSGGVAAVLAPFVHRFGGVALIAGMAVFAPIGTILSTFVLKVWLSFKPQDAAPQAAPAPTPAVAPA
ncbi:MAG: hypothetical protein ACYDDF_06115 [Thermoplasmatota archaeon]